MLPTLLSLALGAPRVDERPNVVIILADDIGYGDLPSYGATKTRMPNVERLAREGVRFTDAHSPSAVCTPTRYALLTGRYAWRNTLGANQVISGVAPLVIEPGRATIASMLKGAGYATGIVGKWHLGLGAKETDYNVEIKPGPKEVGFDESFILPATGDRVPCVYVENGRVVGYDPADPIHVSYRQKVGNDPTGKDDPNGMKQKLVVGHDGTIVNGLSRIGFMSGGKKARWVDEEMADTFARKATSFIGRHRSKPFFLYLATHNVHAPLLPNPRFNGVSQAGLRGDTLAEFDWTVGEVMKSLDKWGLANNTILIVTSDNGAAESDGYADPRENLNGHKVNGVLRDEKYSLYEGGHRVPMIVRYPARARQGVVSNALMGQVDFMASLAILTGCSLKSDDAPDSQNVLAALLGDSQNGRESLVMHRGGGAPPLAYREGRWKLIWREGSPSELYNVEADLSEKTDLAAKEPARVEDMTKRLKRIVLAGRSRLGTGGQ